MKKCIGIIFFVISCVTAARSQQIHYYNTVINVNEKVSVTGICVMRRDSSGGALSLVNEFGIKAFDAAYSDRAKRVKLLNVIGFLDKRYIRRVIEKDLVLLFDPDGGRGRKRSVAVSGDSLIVLTNRRTKTTYKLEPIDNVTE